MSIARYLLYVVAWMYFAIALCMVGVVLAYLLHPVVLVLYVPLAFAAAMYPVLRFVDQ